MKLIPEWRHSWRFSSNWCHAAQVALIFGWTQIPDDLRASSPRWAEVALSATIFGLGVLARAVAQTGVPKAPADVPPHD